MCCSHKSYWVRPDGSTSHCPKFKEVYDEINVEKAYSKHHTYIHFGNNLREGYDALERFGRSTKHAAKIIGMTTSPDADSPDKVPSEAIETANVWLTEKWAKHRPLVVQPIIDEFEIPTQVIQPPTIEPIDEYKEAIGEEAVKLKFGHFLDILPEIKTPKI